MQHTLSGLAVVLPHHKTPSTGAGREREREREINIYVYIYIYILIHVCVFYMCVHGHFWASYGLVIDYNWTSLLTIQVPVLQPLKPYQAPEEPIKVILWIFLTPSRTLNCRTPNPKPSCRNYN